MKLFLSAGLTRVVQVTENSTLCFELEALYLPQFSIGPGRPWINHGKYLPEPIESDFACSPQPWGFPWRLINPRDYDSLPNSTKDTNL